MHDKGHGDLDALKKLVEEGNGRVHNREYDNADIDDPWDIPEPPSDPPPLCVYCNEPWTPEMLDFYEDSGYCETCADSEARTVIACSKCRRIVYKK